MLYGPFVQQSLQLLCQQMHSFRFHGSGDHFTPLKRGDHFINFRSSRIEPLPQILQVQNVDNQDDCVSDPIGGLVRDNRSQGRIFSHRNIATTQEVPEVRFRGHSPQELALRHRDVVLAHLESLGLRLNAKKSVPISCSEDNVLGGCMGFDHDAGTAVSCTQQSILNALKNIKLGQRITVHYLQRVLGLMAAAIQGDTLGLLHMRSFQLWLRARGFHPRANPQRQIRVTRQGLRTLSMWFRPRFLTLGPTLGPCCRRKMLTTDASLTGWGAVLDGRPAQGIWRGHLLKWHINCLEMMALFQALKYFLQQLRGYHVLVRVDNMAVFSYINHQGGLRSHRLNRLAQQVLLWAQDKFLSLRAIYIPGHMNVGADLLSRQAVTHGEWKLHPEVVSQIWERFYEAEVDLFASQETAQCPLYFSLTL